MPRASYNGIVVTCPVTVPYVRHSTRSAHWFVARALDGLLRASGVDKAAVDGLTVSSFSLVGRGCPCIFCSIGFGSKRSTWLGPPYMKRKMTDFAFGAKCGAFGASGFVALKSPSAPSIDCNATEPKPAPACCKICRRVRECMMEFASTPLAEQPCLEAATRALHSVF